MTVIGAGIQILAERLSFVKPVENFRWKNRDKFFEALARNKMENVVLISGDIHLGQLYEAQCTQFTGMNTLPEVTSSGLSHT